MGDGTKENPFTREDVLKLIEKNGGTANELNLSGKYFQESIDLSGINLSGIIMIGARIINADLHGCSFVGANLQNVEMAGANLMEANFANSNCQNADMIAANLQEANLAGANLQGARLRMVNLRGARLWLADFRGTLLWNANFEGAMLEGIKWAPNYVVAHEIESDELKSDIEQIYRNLKQRHTEQGLYGIAGEFFFREMTAKRKEMKWWPNPFNRAFSKFVSILCGYGEKPERVVISAIVFIFGLAVAYLFGGLSLPYSIYFSAVSFTALGYGSWAYTPPENWVQGVGAFESFLGVFMMALFLITFVRKMTR